MGESFGSFLESQPIALLALVLGIGYLIGRIGIRGFELGSAGGVLFAGLIIGQWGFEIHPVIQTCGFVLFIYSVGWQAGPTFFAVLAKDGRKYFMLAVLIGAVGFLLSLVLARGFVLPPGAAAGMLAGALTSSPTLAAATDTVRQGTANVPEGYTADQVLTGVSTSYAITYIFGMVGLILFVKLLPRSLGINLPEEAKKVSAELDDAGTSVPLPSEHGIVGRAYEVANPEFEGFTLGELTKRVSGVVAIRRIKRGGEYIPVADDTVLRRGDRIGFIGLHSEFVSRQKNVGPEIDDKDLLEPEIESCQIVITKRVPSGVKLGDVRVAERYGCFVSRIRRAGVSLPVSPNHEFRRGDVLTVTGPRASLEVLGSNAGHIEQDVDETDLLTFAMGIVVGLIVGVLTIEIGGLSIGLGMAGGLLASGIAVGYLRSLYPVFGRVPSPVRWILMELGLMVFMAGVGLRAGQGILDTLRQAGLPLFASGVVVTTVPPLLGYFFGSKLLKLNPALLLGAITGAMTSSPALGIVNKEARSPVPALGYTGAYTFANVLLTVAGSVIVRL